MMEYILREHDSYGCSVEWRVSDDGQGNVKKLYRITPVYNDKAGKCLTYTDLSLITDDAIVKGAIKRQTVAGLTKGTRAQKARIVQRAITELKAE